MVIFTKNNIDDVHIPMIFKSSIPIGIMSLISRVIFVTSFILQMRMITHQEKFVLPKKDEKKETLIVKETFPTAALTTM